MTDRRRGAAVWIATCAGIGYLQVVIDEVAGQMITFLARPDGGWRWWLAGFVVFRILDVLKPFPAGRAEHLPGGWGVMTDDVIAGFYSLATLLLLGFVFK